MSNLRNTYWPGVRGIAEPSHGAPRRARHRIEMAADAQLVNIARRHTTKGQMTIVIAQATGIDGVKKPDAREIGEVAVINNAGVEPVTIVIHAESER